MSGQNTPTNGLLVIKASAGSGKTYNPAPHYITQLLFTTTDDGTLRLRTQQCYHRHILAITFTNKATNEMKRRILKELYQLATDPEHSNYNDLSEPAGGYGPLQKAAKRALNDVLFRYGAFGVSTIDSFFQSILRNFARELDRDYSYEVEIDEKFAMQQAVHQFLLSLGHTAQRSGSHQTNVEQWVKEFIKRRVQRNGNWDFFNNEKDLVEFAMKTTSEEFGNNMTAVCEYLKDYERLRTFIAITVPEFSKTEELYL